MRKKLKLLLLLIMLIFLYGCGQEVNVTVYNHSGVTPYVDQYIGITASWENGGSRSFFPTDSASSDSEINENNSISFKVKENSQLSVNAWGQYYETDACGNTSLVSIDLGPEVVTVYGGFPDPPSWYVAVFLNEIFIYKK